RLSEHPFVSTYLAEGGRQVGQPAPSALEGVADVAGTFLQGRASDLFSVSSSMRKSDPDLKGAGADADLGPRRHVARAGALIRVGEVAVAVVQVDLQVRASVVADGGSTERADDAHPDVLLAQQQRGRMRIEDLAEVALAPRLPVRRGLHVQAHIWELGCERGRDQHRVLIRIREELLGESIFVVSAVDLEGRDSRRKPGDVVLAVAGVIDRWRTSRRGEEAQLMERY